MILDYSMMQWVLSIVVGISLSRFINTVALMGRKKSRIKFDFLLVSILFATTTNMIHWWFNSPDYFSNIEGKYIPYMFVFLVIIFYAIALKSLLPSSSELESADTVDFREIYFHQKDFFYLAMATIGLIIVGLYILYPEVEGLAFGLESKTVEIPVLVIVGIILPVILIISDNYYLHVFQTILVLLGFTSQVIKYATTMN